MRTLVLLSVTTLFLLMSASLASSYKRGSKHRNLNGPTTTTSPTLLPDPAKTSPGPCENWWCGAGKECQIGADGLAKCGCIRQCPASSSTPVCGTDGQWYWNHCELHRTACLSGDSQMGIDHTEIACTKTKTKSNLKKKTKKTMMMTKEMGKSKKLEEKSTKMENTRQKFDKGFKPNKDFQEYLGVSGLRESVKSKRVQQLNTFSEESDDDDSSFSSSSSSDDEEDDDDSEETSEEDTNNEDDEEDEDELELDRELEEEEKAEERMVQDEMDRRPKKKSPNNKMRSMMSPLGREIRRDSSPSSHCSPQEYEILKDNLLLYNHERMIGGVRNFKAAMEDGGDGPEAGKDYLLSLMFSHLDRNNDGALESEELHKVDQEESSLIKLASGCSIVDLLKFDDSDHNGQLNINEFYTAFNKLYSVSVISLDKALETTHVTATVGDNVEIKCDVSGSPPMPIVWRRYGLDLSTLNQEEQIRVFPDGTLYLNKIQLLHAGNYSCHAQRNQEVIQTHILSVQTLPDVKVMPHIVWEQPGSEVNLDCRVTGEPFPVVQWLKNDEPLPLDMGDKYTITGDGIRLTLKDIYFSDTASYMCKAENSAGKRLDIGSLVVIDQQTPSTVQTSESMFFVFHDRGVSIYDPATCRIQHQIQGTDIVPGTQEYVCGEHSVPCDWGRSVRVSPSYVYVSQPRMDRVLVISTTQMVVVDMVPTDRYPVELHYVPHLDQVWVECWRSEENPAQKTLQVIREAKEKRKHHTVHPEPIDSHFDLVENLFLPPDSHLSAQFRYGYVSHKNGRGLYKMDLIALRYVKSVDLTPYNCVPQHIQFSALYGMVIIQCFEPVTKKPTGQLVLDALTDSVVYFKGDRVGRPYLSPDSRKLITVSHGLDGTTLLLQLIRESGLEFTFDVKTSLNISDVTFFPSQRSHTYDLYASAVDKDDVLFVDLESGKVEMVSGVSAQVGQSSWKSPTRSISSQGLFSKYLATPSADSVFVLNGQTHTINCQIGGLVKPHLLVWL